MPTDRHPQACMHVSLSECVHACVSVCGQMLRATTTTFTDMGSYPAGRPSVFPSAPALHTLRKAPALANPYLVPSLSLPAECAGDTYTDQLGFKFMSTKSKRALGLAWASVNPGVGWFPHALQTHPHTFRLPSPRSLVLTRTGRHHVPHSENRSLQPGKPSL